MDTRPLPARNPATEVAEFDTEIVVLETHSRQVHLLGPMASVVFDACGRDGSVDALVAEVAEWSTEDVDTIRSAIEATLADLARLGLLEGTQYVPPPPCVGCERDAFRSTMRTTTADRGRWWRRRT